jgi:hypothetical protein
VVEHFLGKEEVVSSILINSSKFGCSNEEHGLVDHGVLCQAREFNPHYVRRNWRRWITALLTKIRDLANPGVSEGEENISNPYSRGLKCLGCSSSEKKDLMRNIN